MEAKFSEPDLQETSLSGWIFQQLKRFAADKGRIAQTFADDGSSWTYEKLFQSSVHVAAGLKSVGIKPGEMVSIVARNCHELFAVVIGCVMSDVVLTPNIPELPPSELKQNFLLVDTKFVIAGAACLPAVEETVASMSRKPRVFELQQLYRDTVANGAHVDPATFIPAQIKDPRSHIFLCAFSSGTTGNRKAIALADYGMLRIGVLATPSVAVGPKCSGAQINWVSWWFTMLRTLLRGWNRIFLDKNNAVNLLDAISTFKPTIVFSAPSVAGLLALAIDENPDHWDLSSVRAFIVGGDFLSKITHKELSKKLKVDIYCGYGSTEIGVIFPGEVGSPIVYGSVGKPVGPLKLVDLTTGKDIEEPNKPGEIRVQWTIFHHYVNNPEATAECCDENGWFKTGDIAQFDEEGNYYIVGRIREMFRHCSYEIAPGELEDILKTIPGVKDAAVAGKPAGFEIGYRPTAIVVKSADSKITEKDILDQYEKHDLHESKRLLGGIIFTNEIPRNVNGKIIRQKLQDLLI